MATTISDNGPFDPRITSIPFTQNVASSATPGSNGRRLTRGFVIQEKPVNGVRYRCNFLYNPSTVSVSHSVDASVLADPNAQVQDDVTSGHYIMPLNQSVSFSLLFDRTYELWDPSKLTGEARTMVPRMGVAYDVLSLYKITGIATPMAITGNGGSDGSDTLKYLDSYNKGDFSTGASGPMVYTPVFIAIGSTLLYYGVIQEINIQYTHWTQAMIPQRMQLAVSATLLPSATVARGGALNTAGAVVGSTANMSLDSSGSLTFGRAGR